MATKKMAPKKKAPPKKVTAQKAATAAKRPSDSRSQAVTAPMSGRRLPKLPWTLPARTFGQWAVAIIVFFALVGTWLANTLIDARQEDLVAEIKERVAIQASGRAAVVGEWIDGQIMLSNHMTESDLMRLFTAEMSLQRAGQEGQLRSALVAQIPYMQQTIKEFVTRHNLEAAHVLGRSGQAFLSSRPMEFFSLVQQQGLSAVFSSKLPKVLGMRLADDKVVMDILKPIFVMDDEDRQPSVAGVFMMSVPVEQKLADLLNVGPLARDGERASLLQRVGEDELALVSSGSISMLNVAEKTLLSQTSGTGGEAVLNSPVDGEETFAALLPVPNSPFRIFHEFQAQKALAFMELYRNGVYGMVALATLALIAAALLVIGWLLAQRNRVRVRHQGKTMEALVRAIEIRDPYLAGHHTRMARLAVNLGNDLGLPIRQRSTLYYAAQLSGIGKIFIPQELLNKKGKLTAAERKTMEEHISHAAAVLKDVEFDLPVADVIAQMHERMDGSGYPARLKGSEINVLSRILAACDTYCAMTRPRAYRQALPEPKALKHLKDHTSQYDEKVVRALAARLQA
jgi:HD-GYP domain-containing protein (c-di-GMP phosphodiesterase class II)